MTKDKAAAHDRNTALDLLRTWAIAWVFIWHFTRPPQGAWLAPYAWLGWAGVDLFFVLSGFLIASQLLKPVSLGQIPSIKDFYLRRFFRIIPNYWTVIAIYFLIPGFSESPSLSPLWKFLTFTQNFGLNRFTHAGFSHAWSLCVEEHFYMFLPAIILLLQRYGNPRRVVAFMVGMVVFGFVCRGMLWMRYLSPILGAPFHMPKTFVANDVPYDIQIYYPTYNRLDGLLAGVTVAAIYRLRPQIWKKMSNAGNYFFFGGIVLVLLGGWLSNQRYSFESCMLAFPLISWGFGCLVVAGLSSSSFFSRVRVPGVRTGAALAFSLYLIHKPVIGLVRIGYTKMGLDPASVSVLFASIAASIALSALIYNLVEKPMLAMRDRVVEPPKVGSL